MLKKIRGYSLFRRLIVELDEIIASTKYEYDCILFGYEELDTPPPLYRVPEKYYIIEKHLKRSYLYQLMCMYLGKRKVDALLKANQSHKLIDTVIKLFDAKEDEDKLFLEIQLSFIIPLKIKSNIARLMVNEYIRVRSDRDEFKANLDGISLYKYVETEEGWAYPPGINPYAEEKVSEEIERRKSINRKKNALQEGNPSLAHYKEILKINYQGQSIYEATKYVAKQNNLDFYKIYRNFLSWMKANNINAIKHTKVKK